MRKVAVVTSGSCYSTIPTNSMTLLELSVDSFITFPMKKVLVMGVLVRGWEEVLYQESISLSFFAFKTILFHPIQFLLKHFKALQFFTYVTFISRKLETWKKILLCVLFPLSKSISFCLCTFSSSNSSFELIFSLG